MKSSFALLIKSFLGFTVDSMQKMADGMQKMVDLLDLKVGFFFKINEGMGGRAAGGPCPPAFVDGMCLNAKVR